MTENQHKLIGPDQCPILVREWLPEGEIKGLIHLLHGMAEHGLRYRDFARYMTGKGFAVWVHDHRQHGHSVKHHRFGIFDATDTWEALVRDVGMVQNNFRQRYPELPMFMLGHSMGSIILRSYLQTETTNLAGAVIMGSPSTPKTLLIAGIGIANLIGTFSYYKRSVFLNQLSVGSFNKAVKDAETPFDWISHDQSVIEAYSADPMCGYPYNPAFYRELSKGVLQANKKRHMKNFPSIPVLIISGEEDPAGDFGKGVTAISDRYRRLGKKHQFSLLKGMRHEVLNEVNRVETYELVSAFILANSFSE